MSLFSLFSLLIPFRLCLFFAFNYVWQFTFNILFFIFLFIFPHLQSIRMTANCVTWYIFVRNAKDKSYCHLCYVTCWCLPLRNTSSWSLSLHFRGSSNLSPTASLKEGVRAILLTWRLILSFYAICFYRQYYIFILFWGVSYSFFFSLPPSHSSEILIGSSWPVDINRSLHCM